MMEEMVTNYIIRGQSAITALHTADQDLVKGLLNAMILKGQPESFKPFAVHMMIEIYHVDGEL